MGQHEEMTRESENALPTMHPILTHTHRVRITQLGIQLKCSENHFVYIFFCYVFVVVLAYAFNKFNTHTYAHTRYRT